MGRKSSRMAEFGCREVMLAAAHNRLCSRLIWRHNNTMSTGLFLNAPRKDYSHAETRMDAAIHVAGLVCALLAVPVLIGAALMISQIAQRPETFLAAIIYGLSFIAMIGASALYNLTPQAGLNWLYRRLDHSAIYLKIAGTYTPFTLISGQGLWLLAGLWGAAALGIVIKALNSERFHWLAVLLYLAMGWAGVMILPQMLQSFPPLVVGLIIAGGSVYTLGVVFYLWRRLRFHYAIWHVFVLVASLLLYGAVLLALLTVTP